MTDETTLTGVSPEFDEDALASAFGDVPNEGESVPDALAAEPEESTDSETPDTGDVEQPTESGIETLDDLIKQLEVDPEQIMGLRVKLKIDGEEKDATLAELIKVNQLEGHVNRKSIELSEKQKAWEAEQANLRNEWQQKIQLAGSVVEHDEQQLAQQYQSIDWNGLYNADPAQYSALQLRFQQAMQEIQGRKSALAQHYQQNVTQMREQIRPKAIETIRSQNPDLADDASYSNALGEIKGYLKSIGANEQNFDAVEMDPVVFRVARDAARYQQIASKKPDVTNKVKSAPQMQKPSPTPQLGAQAARLKGMSDRASRGDPDAMAFLLENSL